MLPATTIVLQRFLLIIVSIIFTGCSNESKPNKDFLDEAIDLTIDKSSGEPIQFPDLYDGLTDNLPDDKDEKLVLVEKLKERGFVITSWGRGNMPPLGPRIIGVELKKGTCICKVNKMYYSTAVDTLFQRAEEISCAKTGSSND